MINEGAALYPVNVCSHWHMFVQSCGVLSVMTLDSQDCEMCIKQLLPWVRRVPGWLWKLWLFLGGKDQNILEFCFGELRAISVTTSINVPGTLWGCVRHWGCRSAPQEMLLGYFGFLNFSNSLEKKELANPIFLKPKMFVCPEFRIPCRRNEMTLSCTVTLPECNPIGQSANHAQKQYICAISSLIGNDRGGERHRMAASHQCKTSMNGTNSTLPCARWDICVGKRNNKHLDQVLQKQ